MLLKVGRRFRQHIVIWAAGVKGNVPGGDRQGVGGAGQPTQDRSAVQGRWIQ